MFIKIIVLLIAIVAIFELYRNLRRRNQHDLKEETTLDSQRCQYCNVYVSEQPELDEKGVCRLCNKKVNSG